LYHLPLSPFCRKIRLVLREKGLDFSLVEENPWEKRYELLKLNHACQVPVLLESGDKIAIADSTVIFEYLEEVYPDVPLLPKDSVERAEARRLQQWFDIRFYNEVTVKLLHERVYKRFLKKGMPDSASIRAGTQNIKSHLKYISWLLYRRNWLAGSQLTIADFAAAAHLSVLDYISDVPWEESNLAKQWYARIKSRPAFRELLHDYIGGIPMPAHYPDLDF
jgi:glutathione S-transferase